MSTPATSLICHPKSWIDSPTSVQDHSLNVAAMAANADVLVEHEYRKLFPQVSHREYIEIVNQPEFWDQLRRELRNEIGISSYRRILLVMMQRAEEGDINAARFFLAELGISEERRAVLDAVKSGSLYEEHIGRMAEAVSRALDKGKPKTIDVEADVR